MIDTFNLRLNATELQDYMDSQPLAGTRMVFNENTPGVHVRYTPRNDTDMLYFKMKWADDILKPGSPHNILANVIIDQNIRMTDAQRLAREDK